ASSSSKIPNTFKARIASHQIIGPFGQSGFLHQQIKVTALQWRIADYDFGGVGLQCGFNGRANQRRVRNQRFDVPRPLIPMHNKVRLYNDTRAFFYDLAEWTIFVAGPTEFPTEIVHGSADL